MKITYWKRPLKSQLRIVAGLAVLSAVVVPLMLARAADAKGEQPSSASKPAQQQTKAPSSKAKPKVPPKKLTGAELYSIHCNRCHPERYPTERTAAQWKTILLHMEIRANLPANQSRTILKYLQDNSGR